jgi:hypothetical protein
MKVPLFGLGQRGKSPQVTAQSRVNCYVEIQPEEDRTKIAIYPTPGLTLFCAVGALPSRGLWPIDAYLYTVHGNQLFRVSSAGVLSAPLGQLSTSAGQVDMADNGTQLIIVDGANGYIYNTATGVFSTIGGGFPGNPDYVVYQDTYFIVAPAASNQFFVSASLDGTSWSAANFATTQTSPEDIQRVAAANNILHLFSEFSTEFWQNTGGIDFPYSRISGAAASWGLHACWSLAPLSGSLAGLFQDRMGQFFAGMLNGFQIQRLSNAEIESIWTQYPVSTDAVGHAYLLGGHPMYQLSFPAQGASWLYDASSKVWSQLKDSNGGRHWAQRFAHFDGPEKNIVSDYRNGNLYQIDAAAATDNGSAIVTELVSRHISQDEDFLIINELELILEKGVGLTLGQGVNPQVMLSVSKDGGVSYGPERFASLGAVGATTTRARFLRLGSARDWTFKLRISDPVKRVITGGSINAHKASS